MTLAYDVAVVGGGIVGLAASYQLLRRSPGRPVVVLEKEATVGFHQSTHNSGVLHAGVYYVPGSMKARCCVRGKRLLEAFAAEHGIAVLRRGKLVVAANEDEVDRLRALAQRAHQNGVPDMALLGPAAMQEVEPAVVGVLALHVPGTAVTDFGAVCEALAGEIRRLGGEVRTSVEVMTGQETTSGVRLGCSSGDVETKVAVNCAGLRAGRLAEALGVHRDERVAGIPGGWFEVSPEAAAVVRGNIYSVPDPRFPFLGVHLTRRVDDCVWAGPDAPRPGTETLESVDIRRRQCWEHIRRLVPYLAVDDLRPGLIGVRAQAIRADGSMVHDFLIHSTARVVHVLNTPSPAATSSLALGQHLAGEVESRWA